MQTRFWSNSHGHVGAVFGSDMEHGRNQPGVGSRALTSQLNATQARAATARVSPKKIADGKLPAKLLAAVRVRLHGECRKSQKHLCSIKFYMNSELQSTNSQQSSSPARPRFKIEPGMWMGFMAEKMPLVYTSGIFLGHKPHARTCKHLVKDMLNSYCSCK